MRILITNHVLSGRTGSELFAFDLAVSLRAAGHEPAVYAPVLGPLAEDLRARGIVVVARPRDTGAAPDVIHGQHHLPAMAALCAFPGVPAIYLTHGYLPWDEKPPLHPRIRIYAGVVERMRWWLAELTRRSQDEIRIIPNIVDPRRFHPARAFPGKVERAVLFTNATGPEDSEWTAVREAAARCNIEIGGLGAKFGNADSSPERILQDADLVFATGRCALEALACGCAVIPYSRGGIGEQVTPAGFADMERVNFTVRNDVPRAGVAALCGAMTSVDAGGRHELVKLVSEGFGPERVISLVVPMYREAMESSAGVSSEADEAGAVANYLAEIAAAVKDRGEHHERMRTGWEETKRKLAGVKAERDELRARLRKRDGGGFSRIFGRRGPKPA